MKVLSAEEMRGLEKKADASGVSFHQMMENAGLAVAEAIREEGDAERFPLVLVLVGPGNNGGDGLVVARHLAAWGYQVAIYLAAPRPEEDENLKLATEAGAHLVPPEKDEKLRLLGRVLSECALVVDAIFGTGVSRPIEGRFRDILALAGEKIAARRKAARGFSTLPEGNAWLKDVPERTGAICPRVVAVDLPSGLNTDTGELDPVALPADLTVTFAFPKRGHFLFPGASAVGRLLVADIGIRREWAKDVPVSVMTPEAIAAMLPSRPLDSNKGTFGRAFIVAGSVNYTGAAGLASRAAVRSGAGLVTLCCGASVRSCVASQMLEVTYLVLPEEVGVLAEAGAPLVLDQLREGHVLLVGPGMGQEETTRRLIWTLLGIEAHRRRQRIGFVGQEGDPKVEAGGRATVVDADGLNALATLDGWAERLKPRTCILTPHPGEMARLSGLSIKEIQADRIGTAVRSAKEWGQVLVLKGAHTVVASPDGQAAICPFANPALATAGTGDVLSGILVGLLSQGMSLFDAAVAGVYIHALASEFASKRTGTSGMGAGDLLDWIPVATAHVRGS